MGQTTKISWADHTSSPWYGCAEVHAGCDNCYARELSKRNPDTLGVWGPEGTRVKSKSFIANLRRWNAAAKKQGKVVSVFPSLCDPFEDRPELVPWRSEMFAVAHECPWVNLLLLTKRPQNVLSMWPCPLDTDGDGDCHKCHRAGRHYRDNVWLLYSASDQPSFDAGIGPLLECRDLVPVLGISAEPLLGPIDMSGYLPTGRYFLGVCERCGHVASSEKWRQASNGDDYSCYCPKCESDSLEEARNGIRLVITGGESGPRARPHNIEWSRAIGAQCQVAGVSWFHKQHGSFPFEVFPALIGGLERGIKLNDKSGSDPSEWGDGWLQQMPEVN